MMDANFGITSNASIAISALSTRCNTPILHNILMGLNWHCIRARSELGKNNHGKEKLSKGSIPFNGQNVQLVHWWGLVQHCDRHTLLFNHLLPYYFGIFYINCINCIRFPKYMHFKYKKFVRENGEYLGMLIFNINFN
jgi:hypothetical protein